MENKNKYWGLLFYFIIAFAISYIIVQCNINGYKQFIEISFLFTFIGVLIGFALTLFTYIVSQVEKIKEKIEAEIIANANADMSLYNTKKSNLLAIHEEIKDDISVLFWSLIIVVFISISTEPIKCVLEFKMCYISFFHKYINFFVVIKNSFLFSVFILCILAIRDLINLTLKMAEQSLK